MHLFLLSLLAAVCTAAPQFPLFHGQRAAFGGAVYPGASYPGTSYPGPGYQGYPGPGYQGYPVPSVGRDYNARARSGLDRAAAILRADSQLTGAGYNYAYETDNGIQAQQSGVESGGTQAVGSYSYVGDDGRRYSVRYSAGAGGFRAEGEHLPTAPPLPPAIARALQRNAADEARGIFDDGSYRGAGAGTPRLRNGIIQYGII